MSSSIEKLTAAISKKMDDSKEGFKVLQTFGKATEYISLGNYLLNAQLSGDLFKGLPNTRSLELAGKSGTGKSFLCLNMVRDCITKGYHVFYIDTEGAIDEEDLENFGITISGITHVRTIKTFELCQQFINQVISGVREEIKSSGEQPKVAIFLDSIGLLNTTTALENALKGNYKEDMGKRAKIVRDLFRTVTLDLSNLGIPFVFTNHTANSVDLFAIDNEVTSSGEGPTFAASFITLLGKTNYMKEESEDGKKRTGVILRAKSHKNRKVAPVEIKFHLSYKEGMIPYVGLEEFLSWDICEVDFGSLFTEDEYNDRFKGKAPTNSKKEELPVHSWTKDGKTYFAVLNPNIKTLVVKSSCSVVESSQIFNMRDGEKYPDGICTAKRVFTDETLSMINEKIIKPKFAYSKSDNTSEVIGEMLEEVKTVEKKSKK